MGKIKKIYVKKTKSKLSSTQVRKIEGRIRLTAVLNRETFYEKEFDKYSQLKTIVD